MRRNVNEAQAARTEDAMWNDLHRVTYKCGSMMLSEYCNGRLALKTLNRAEKIIIGLNSFFECNVLTGDKSPGCCIFVQSS